jgi:hypothetical protein
MFLLDGSMFYYLTWTGRTRRFKEGFRRIGSP